MKNEVKSNKLNIVVFWIICIGTSSLTSYTIFMTSEFDLKYIESADNLSAYILSAILVLIVHIFAHTIFMFICLIKKATIDTKCILIRRNETLKNTIRIFGYVIALLFFTLYSYHLWNEPVFVIWEALFYLTSIVATFQYIIWVISILKKHA